MEFYTYILKSLKDNRFYFGQSMNLEQRLQEHNKGKSKYTKPFIPWALYAYKPFSTRSEAMKYEKMLKNLHSQQKVFDFIAKHGFFLVGKNT
jgi:putative endonuclease